MSLKDLMTMAKPAAELRLKTLCKVWKAKPVDCFQCMRCTSGCTSLKLLELKPHEIVDLVKFGFVDELLASDIVWTCATCLKCKERCPQRASPYDLIMAIRNVIVEREAKVPEFYMKAVGQILETGLLQSVQKVTTRKMETYDRDGLGLSKMVLPGDKFKEIFMKALGGA
ncbi:MAG TPA: 4Fe-4S dicluster domain-containing protein [Candidatus Krumholzibacteriaceae bacterium]|nr:4Fe-4S dicluster domain-containing protein [Candidatus Krumholzibacteriaceae bacterium]